MNLEFISPLAAPTEATAPLYAMTLPMMPAAEQLVVRLEARQAFGGLRQSYVSQLRQYDENFSQWVNEHEGAADLWAIACGLAPSLAWPFFACSQQAIAAPTACLLLLAELASVPLDDRASVDEQALVSAWRGELLPLLSLTPSTSRAQLARHLHLAPSNGFNFYERWANARPAVELTDFYWLGAAATAQDLPTLLAITVRNFGTAATIRVAAGSCYSQALPWLAEQLQSMAVRGQAYLAVEALLGPTLMLELLPELVLRDVEPWQDEGTVQLLVRQINKRWLQHLPEQLLHGLPLCQYNLSALRHNGAGWVSDIAAAQQWLRSPPLGWQPAARWQARTRQVR